jgi:peptidoglycan hydrolase-like protein with peptidoglycan-binding domain
MALQSRLFSGDRLLEAAASRDADHVTLGARGEHVRKIQKALNLFGGAPIDEDGIYGRETAAAVLTYKRQRNIVNRSYQTQADDIVGKMTIASLDVEVLVLEALDELVNFFRSGYLTLESLKYEYMWVLKGRNLRKALADFKRSPLYKNN